MMELKIALLVDQIYDYRLLWFLILFLNHSVHILLITSALTVIQSAKYDVERKKIYLLGSNKIKIDTHMFFALLENCILI